MLNKFLYFTLALGVVACAQPKVESQQEPEAMAKYANDTHSFSEPNQVAITHLDLDISVDFDTRTLSGNATYTLERNGGDTLKLDLRGLEIHAVKNPANGEELPHSIVKIDRHGDGLSVSLTPTTTQVEIAYTTSPDAAALLWMEPAQTLGGTAPFLFTQGQAILTRSWIPIQDSPAIRLTYSAKVKAPEGMLAVMSATNPTAKNDSATYSFEMKQPIPPYLMALAVGDLDFAPLGERTGVYAEPAMLEKAAYEFADVEKMLEAAEDLYGPYAWERYDLLVLPPSFPFGGMENPRLTFATPTIIAGDRSLTSLVAHELAHSWSGNLVTNATWDDFWLNEGFTVYFEKRIMESLYGRDYAEMLNVLGYQDVQNTIKKLGKDSPDTHLKLALDGRDPDDGMTDIAYEKGYLFLRWLEEMVGRERFDVFLRNYFDRHAFQTMTTDDFILYLDSNLLNELDSRPDIEQWIFQPGLPAGHPRATSSLFAAVDLTVEAWLTDKMPTNAIPAAKWSTHEWLHFLRRLPTDLGVDKMERLDKAWNLTETKNSEIAAAWFLLAIQNDYQVAFPALAAFLDKVGRRKFIQPLYEALMKTEAHKAWARAVYADARDNYHAVAVSTLDEILGWEG
jgi:leukotriene A-4 hydrolase/aminopeptidase